MIHKIIKNIQSKVHVAMFKECKFLSRFDFFKNKNLHKNPLYKC